MPYGTQNIAEAKRLVAAAGATGKSVSIIADTDDSTDSPIAQVIQQEIAKTGLNVKILTLDSGLDTKDEFSGDPLNFDMSIQYFAGFTNPSTVLADWDSTLSPWEKAYSPSTPAEDAAIVKASHLPPGHAENAAILKACKMIAQAANMIPLVTRANAYVAYRTDLVHPVLQAVEGDAIPFRYIWEYAVPHR